MSPLWSLGFRRTLSLREHHRFRVRRLWLTASLIPLFKSKDALRPLVLILVLPKLFLLFVLYHFYYPTLAAVVPGVAYCGGLSSVEYSSVGHGEAPFVVPNRLL